MICSIVESSLRLRSLVVAIAPVGMTVDIFRFDNLPVDVLPKILPPIAQSQTEVLGLSASEIQQLILTSMAVDHLGETPWRDRMRGELVPGPSILGRTFEPGSAKKRGIQSSVSDFEIGTTPQGGLQQ